jgi:hypothetical protein
MAAEASMAEDAMESELADDALSDFMADDSAEDDAMEESAMDDVDDAEDEVLPADDDGGESGATNPAPSTTTTGGLFPDEPVRLFDSVPAIEGLLADLPAPRTDLLASRCGLELDDLTELEIVGFLPIEIGGDPAEVFAVLTEDGSDSAIIADQNCQLLTAEG